MTLHAITTRDWHSGRRVAAALGAWLLALPLLLAPGAASLAETPTVTPTPAFAPTPALIGDAVQAAARGDADWLKQWLDTGGDPNRADANGWTPLLKAAVRGQAPAVAILLKHPERAADPGLAFAPSGALPIHLAGQSGDVETARLLLDARPEELDATWLLNGHTLLLQAAFFGHVELARFALERGANPSATTLRRLTALDFAQQFQNRPLIEALSSRPPDPAARDVFFQDLLERIREPVPAGEADAQRRADVAGAAIDEALKRAGATDEPIDDILNGLLPKLDDVEIDRIAGDLRQPLMVIAVTGNDPGPDQARSAGLRVRIVEALLARGANPLVKEHHPMGATAIIRASVFGHLECLKRMAAHLSAAQLADALNEIPAVNGLTGLHDAVLRAGTVSVERLPHYLEQIRWEVGSGARFDIEDFSGRTQRQYAEAIADLRRRAQVLEIFDSRLPVPQWNHVAIAVPVLEDAMAWYGDVFGFVPLTKPIVHTPAVGARWQMAVALFGPATERIRFVRLRAPAMPFGQTIEFFEIAPKPTAPPPEAKRTSGLVHACLVVGDPETFAARIEARGGVRLSAANFGEVQVIFCADPWGNIIELASGPW